MVLISSLDIIIGTETWLDPTFRSSEIFHDYYLYDIERRDRPKDPHGEVLIAAKKQLQLGNITKSKDIELITGSVSLEGKKKMLVGAFYCPPDKTDKDYLNKVKEEISTIKDKYRRDIFVIGGDFNLPDINWEEQTIINRQYPIKTNQTFLEIVADNGLEQIVDFPTGKDNTLDLMLLSHPAYKLRCKPPPSIGNSDHDIVLLDIACKPFKPKPVRRKIYIFHILFICLSYFLLNFLLESFISIDTDIKINCKGVTKLLKNQNIHKTTGPDSIPSFILKSAADQLVPILTDIFQTTIDTGEVPQDWRDANIVPLFKKDERYLASNYSPVSLTSITQDDIYYL
jgi:hypothetical protein